MKNSIIKVMVAIVILLSSTVNAQIKNAKTETFKVYGNCGMCESKIEKSGSVKKIAKVDWNQETSMATITYDAKKTTSDEVLKRIALAGYDSDKFLAPDDVYSNLHGCCQYDRVAKIATEKIKNVATLEKVEKVKISGNCGMCKRTIEKSGNVADVAKVEWNKETGIATLTFNESKTTKAEILKRIAAAGYDNELFKATEEVYSNLPGCCQYDRE